MSVLVVGLSHRSAPVALLERAALAGDAPAKLLARRARQRPRRRGAGAVHLQPGRGLRRRRQVPRRRRRACPSCSPGTRRSPLDELTPHLYVHYEDRAVAAPVLGGLRPGLDGRRREPDPRPGARTRCASAQEQRHRRPAARRAGPAGAAGRQAGAHRDRHRPRRARPWSPSGWTPAAPVARPAGRPERAGRRRRLDERAGRDRRCAAPASARVVVANRTPSARAAAGAPSVGGRGASSWPSWPPTLADADLVVSCTGAVGHVLDADDRCERRAQRRRPAAGRPRPGAAARRRPGRAATSPASRVVDLEALAEALADAPSAPPTSTAVRRDRRRRGRRLPRPAARGQRRADRGRAARAWPTRSSTPSWPGCAGRLPDLDDRQRATRSSRPCAGSSTSCCTRRPCGSSSSPSEPGGARLRRRAARAVRPRPRARSRPSRRAELDADGAAMTADDRPRPLRLGTRRSALAMAQSAAGRRRARPRRTGRAGRARRDHHRTATLAGATLAQIGGTGVFVTRAARGAARRRGRLRRALAQGPADRAAPTASSLAAVPPREDPRDALVARDGLTLGELPAGSPDRHRLAAPGRAAARARPRPRGRRRSAATSTPGWARSRDGELDAVVLARAGLARLGRLDEVTEVLDPTQMLPAPGQGALAVECRGRRRPSLRRRCSAALDDPSPGLAVTAERSLLAALEAGCSRPGRGATPSRAGRRAGVQSCTCVAVVGAVDGSAQRAAVRHRTARRRRAARPRPRGRAARRGCGRSDGGARHVTRAEASRARARHAARSRPPRQRRLRRRRPRRPRPADPARRRAARRRRRRRRRVAGRRRRPALRRRRRRGRRRLAGDDGQPLGVRRCAPSSSSRRPRAAGAWCGCSTATRACTPPAAEEAAGAAPRPGSPSRSCPASPRSRRCPPTPASR